jgi:hypothetical protein
MVIMKLERFEFSLNHYLRLGVTPAKAGVQLWKKEAGCQLALA